MRDSLHKLIAHLRLNGIAKILDAELDRAEREALTSAEVLERLFFAEAAFQRERSLAWRLTQARLPWN